MLLIESALVQDGARRFTQRLPWPKTSQPQTFTYSNVCGVEGDYICCFGCHFPFLNSQEENDNWWVWHEITTALNCLLVFFVWFRSVLSFAFCVFILSSHATDSNHIPIPVLSVGERCDNRFRVSRRHISKGDFFLSFVYDSAAHESFSRVVLLTRLLAYMLNTKPAAPTAPNIFSLMCSNLPNQQG